MKNMCCKANNMGHKKDEGEIYLQNTNPFIEKNIYTYRNTFLPYKNISNNEYKYAEKNAPRKIITEKIIEVPQVLHQEKIVTVPKVEIVERVIPVRKTQIVENVLEVPQYQFKQVPVEKVIEIPEVRTEVLLKEVKLPQNIDVPVPQLRQLLLPQNIDRNVALPVELNTVQNYKMPKIKPKYVEVSVPIYVPRYIEVPVPVQYYEGEENDLKKNNNNKNKNNNKKNNNIENWNIFNKNVFNKNFFNNCLNNQNYTQTQNASHTLNPPSSQTLDEDVLGLTDCNMSQGLNNNELIENRDSVDNLSRMVSSSATEVRA